MAGPPGAGRGRDQVALKGNRKLSCTSDNYWCLVDLDPPSSEDIVHEINVPALLLRYYNVY